METIALIATIASILGGFSALGYLIEKLWQAKRRRRHVQIAAKSPSLAADIVKNERSNWYDPSLTRLFIVYATDDESVGEELCDVLQAQGFKVASERTLQHERDSEVKLLNLLRNSDHVLFIASASSAHSDQVARILGLSFEFRKKRGGRRPSIVPIIPDVAYNSAIKLAHYLPGDLKEEDGFSQPWSFDQTKDLSGRNLSDLVEYLSTSISFIDNPYEQKELLEGSFEIYEELFPEGDERDKPDDIVTWLDEAQNAAISGSPWRDVYAVLHTGGTVFGMAFITAHVTSGWIVANYFGVMREWRSSKAPVWFADKIKEQLLRILPTMKGVLFEVEPVDVPLLERASDRMDFTRCSEHRMDPGVLKNLRRLQRLELWQRGWQGTGFKARVVLGSNGKPLPYWQPAMQEPLKREHDTPLLLMVAVLGGQSTEYLRPDDMVSFLYDDFYGDAYGEGVGSVEIPNYRAYVQRTKLRVLKGCVGSTLGKIEVPKKVKKFLADCRKSDSLSEQLFL